jgi:uncharacterized protein
MLEFKILTLEDKDLFDSYIKKCKFLTSEYSFISLFIWRKAFDTRYCIYKDALIIKKRSTEFGSFFMQPIGYRDEDLNEIIETLIEYKNINNMEYLFRNVEAPFLKELERISKERFQIGIEENNFDYIYESENLINLSGRKLSSKRNHITRFVNSYNYRVEDISTENTQECINAAKEWCMVNNCNGLLNYETESIITMLNNWNLLKFQGIVVYVDDKISAFTIGEIANEEMAIIHVEKAFSEVHGLYPFINKTFVEKYFKDIKFINREDDMGLEGIRKAKQSYHPYKLEYKQTVNL